MKMNTINWHRPRKYPATYTPEQRKRMDTFIFVMNAAGMFDAQHGANVRLNARLRVQADEWVFHGATESDPHKVVGLLCRAYFGAIEV